MPANSYIPAHFTTEFDANWQHLAQQKLERTKEYVMVDTVEGKEKKFNQLGKAEFQPIIVRAGETRIVDRPTDARWLRPLPFDIAELLDEWDEKFLGIVKLPDSEMVTSQGYAYARLIDKTILAAAVGTAYTGETGVTPVVLPAAQIIDVNFVETGSAANSGLTIGKLRQAAFKFDDAEVPEDETKTLFLGAKQIQDLLRTTEVTSSDFANVKALAEGQVDTFMGFKIRRVSKDYLPYNSGTDVRNVIACVKSGIRLADTGRRTYTDIRPDKSHALQIRSTVAMGATRMEEVKVVSIACDESP